MTGRGRTRPAGAYGFRARRRRHVDLQRVAAALCRPTTSGTVRA